MLAGGGGSGEDLDGGLFGAVESAGGAEQRPGGDRCRGRWRSGTSRVWVRTSALPSARDRTKDWVYDEVEAGRLPYVRLGRKHLRFRRPDLARFLAPRARPAVVTQRQ